MAIDQVSVPLRGLEVFGRKMAKQKKDPEESFRPLAGIRGLRTILILLFLCCVVVGFRPLAGIRGLRTRRSGMAIATALQEFPSPCGD